MIFFWHFVNSSFKIAKNPKAPLSFYELMSAAFCPKAKMVVSLIFCLHLNHFIPTKRPLSGLRTLIEMD